MTKQKVIELEDYLKRIIKVLDEVGEDTEFTNDQLKELLVCAAELMSREVPEDIIEAVTDWDTSALRFMIKEINGGNYIGTERCWYCGTHLGDEDYQMETQWHPWGSTTAPETYIAGYHCHNCGNEDR